MPTINPLLYSDQSENEILAAPGAELLHPPKLGLMSGFGSAMATTAENTAKAVWATGEEAVARSVMGTETFETVQQKAPDLLKPKMEKIDPLTTGAAAQVLAPLTMDVALMALGPVGLAAATAGAASRERLTTYGDLREQGVDAQTALQTANEKMAETALTYQIARIPFAKQIGQLGSRTLRWGARAAVGTGVTTSLDFIGGESRAAILEAGGYKDQAAQMRKWDTMRVVSDVIGGSMLGLTTRSPFTEDQQLAKWWIQQADQLQHESAPGLPTSPAASGATANATLKAADDLLNGQPVNVGDVPGLMDAHFLAYRETNLPVMRQNVADHEKIVAHYDSEIATMRETIEKARRDGHDDIADHFETEELPRLQQIRNDSERLADQWRDDVATLEHPQELSPAAVAAKPGYDAHVEESAAIRQAAEDFRAAPDETTPAAMANATGAARRDVATEAREMLQNYRNPVAEATGEAAQAAPAPKLSPAQQQIVDMHNELRQVADQTNDPELHAALDQVMADHQLEHLEAGKFNVAALCAIG